MAKVVKFTSFNVNGLNGPVKRKRVYDYLKKLKTEYIFKKAILPKSNIKS